MRSRWGRRRARGRRAAARADEIERPGRADGASGPDGDAPPAGDPSDAAAAAAEQVAELLASDLPGLEDDQARAGLRQVGSNLSSAMSALAPYRTSTDTRLRAAYSSVHEAITDLAAVYAWLTFGPGRAQRIQRARDQRRREDRR